MAADRPMVLMLVAFLVTYLMHSSILLSAALFMSERLRGKLARYRESLLRIALFGSVLSAITQVLGLSRMRGALTVDGVSLSAAARAVRNDGGAATNASSFGVVLFQVIAAAAVVVLLLAIMRLSRLVAAHIVLRRALRGRVPARVSLITRARAIAGDRSLRVSTSDGVVVPFLLGREIILPSHAVGVLTSAQTDAVLAHEIAHIKRRDQLWLPLGDVVTRLLFVQPLNRRVAERLRSLSECACDDWALDRTADPHALATALALAANWVRTQPVHAMAVAMATHESLAMTRVRRILDPDVHRFNGRPSRAFCVASGALLLMGMTFGAPGITLAAAERMRPSSPSSTDTPVTELLRTVSASDDAGQFTVTFRGDRVVRVTIDGELISTARFEQAHERLRVFDADGNVTLDLRLRPTGFSWTSRPRTATSH